MAISSISSLINTWTSTTIIATSFNEITGLIKVRSPWGVALTPAQGRPLIYQRIIPSWRVTLEDRLGVNEPPSSVGSRVAKSLEGARILGTNRVLQGAAKKRMFSWRRWNDAALGAKGETGDVEMRGGGFIDFLPRGPVTRFVGPSCTVIGCSYPRREGLDAPQDASSPRKSPIVSSIVREFLRWRLILSLARKIFWSFWRDSEANLLILAGKLYIIIVIINTASKWWTCVFYNKILIIFDYNIFTLWWLFNKIMILL